MPGSDGASFENMPGEKGISVRFGKEVAFQKRMRQIAQFVMQHWDPVEGFSPSH